MKKHICVILVYLLCFVSMMIPSEKGNKRIKQSDMKRQVTKKPKRSYKGEIKQEQIISQQPELWIDENTVMDEIEAYVEAGGDIQFAFGMAARRNRYDLVETMLKTFDIDYSKEIAVAALNLEEPLLTILLEVEFQKNYTKHNKEYRSQYINAVIPVSGNIGNVTEADYGLSEGTPLLFAMSNYGDVHDPMLVIQTIDILLLNGASIYERGFIESKIPVNALEFADIIKQSIMRNRYLVDSLVELKEGIDAIIEKLKSKE